MPDLKTTLGYIYWQKTKFDRRQLRQMQRPAIAGTEREKIYPGTETFPLPRPGGALERALQTILSRRRSRRRYHDSGISLENAADLVWAAQGVTGQAGPYRLRTAPSAGALYPVETYLAVTDVTDIPSGLYHLRVRDFHLECLARGAFGPELARGCLDQAFVAEAPLVFVWSAVARRNMAKYGHRGFRYICMDLGHICQNVVLAAEALGLGACPVAALYDDELNALFGLDGEEESVLYAASIGRV